MQAPGILPASSLAASLIARAEGEARSGSALPATTAPAAAVAGAAGGGQETAQDSSFNAVKIFVGGLPPSVDLLKLQAFFEQFGRIEDSVVMMDGMTNRSRGFGFVTFAESASADAAVAAYSSNAIDGKWVEVKRCVPREQRKGGGCPSSLQAAKGCFGKGGGCFGKGGGCFGGGGFGKGGGCFGKGAFGTGAFGAGPQGMDHLQQMAQQQLSQQLGQMTPQQPQQLQPGPAAWAQQPFSSPCNGGKGGWYAPAHASPY